MERIKNGPGTGSRPTTLRGVFDMLNGVMSSALVSTALELKVFSLLSRPLSADAAAERLHAHPGNTQCLLDGLAACGLIAKSNGIYSNSELARTYLVKGAPGYIGEIMLQMYRAARAEMADLTHRVLSGPPQVTNAPLDMGAESTWEAYSDAVACYQQACTAPMAVSLVRDLPGFSDMATMLDLGGGPGMIAAAIVKAHPTMTGVVYDMPAVASAARKYIARAGLAGRIKAKGGDYLKDPIGRGYDLIWASATLNFAGPDLDLPVRKIAGALNPGGVFISLSDGMTCEDTRPVEYVLNKLPYALLGRDMGIRKGRIAASMARSGLTLVSSTTVDTPMMPMDLEIARKSPDGPLPGEMMTPTD